jgi:c-di-GMP-binding flagellar brake protein YcgR
MITLEQSDLTPAMNINREGCYAPRYHIDVKIRGEVISRGERKPIRGRGGDLSQRGMLLYLPFELSVGETIRLEFTLPYCSQPLKLEAVVRNRRSLAYGIEFLNATAVQQMYLERSCRMLSLRAPVLERRRSQRTPLDVRVKLLTSEAGREKITYGRSTDICEGGMGVTLTCELPEGTQAMLVFKLPGEEWERSFQAQLKYHSGFRHGFEFTRMLPEQVHELRAFCVRAEK